MTTYIQNKKVNLNYEMLKEYEAGISLLGTEVKAVRSKLGKLDGSHVVIRGKEAFLVGASISAFQKANAPDDFDPERTRKLLLSKKQLFELERDGEKAGLTIVPIALYNSGQKLKLKIALARGKKKHDKRETLKARDTKREIERALKQQ